MALIKCTECGAEISSLAAACPTCGAPKAIAAAPFTPASKTRPAAWVALAIIGALAAYAMLPSPKSPSPASPETARAAAIETAKAPEPTEEEKAKAAKEQLRDERVLIAVSHIKRTLRDPDSLKWEIVASDDTGHVICIGYRARNGFGGMNRVKAVVVGSKISKAREHVKKYCNDPSGFTNMTTLVDLAL